MEIQTDNRLTFKEIKIALFRTLHGFFFFFGLFFGGIPLMIAVITGVTILKERDLIANGSSATATIVGKRISSSDDSTSYYIAYEFRASNSRQYGGEASVSKRTYYGTEKGSQIKLFYDPDDPFRTVLPDETQSYWVLLFLALFIAIGGIFFTIGIRGLRRKIKLFGRGMSTLGRNRGIQYDSSTKVNDKPCRYMQFEYTDFQGRKHTCKSSYLSEDQVAQLETVSEIPVVYTPEAPDQADLDFEKLTLSDRRLPEN